MLVDVQSPIVNIFFTGKLTRADGVTAFQVSVRASASALDASTTIPAVEVVAKSILVCRIIQLAPTVA
jgi:hypothetical protein